MTTHAKAAPASTITPNTSIDVVMAADDALIVARLMA